MSTAAILAFPADRGATALARVLANSYKRHLGWRSDDLAKVIRAEWELARKALDSYRHAMRDENFVGAITLALIAQHHRGNAKNMTGILRPKKL